MHKKNLTDKIYMDGLFFEINIKVKEKKPTNTHVIVIKEKFQSQFYHLKYRTI